MGKRGRGRVYGRREGKARGRKREKGSEREWNRKGMLKGKNKIKLKNGMVGKEIKFLATLYTPGIYSVSPE